MSNTKKVLINSVTYTVGNILLKAFSFFLIPLYTSYLSTAEYGKLNLSNGFTAVATAIISLSLYSAVIRYYADYKHDRQMVKRLFGTAVSFYGLVSLCFLTLAFLLRDWITEVLFEGVSFYPVVLLSVTISVVSAFYTLYQEILKGMQNARKSVLLSYLFFFLLIGGNVLCVVFLEMGAAGILLSTLIVNSLMVVLMFIDLYRNDLCALCLDGRILRDLLGYSLPLVPHTLSYSVSSYATRLIINQNMSLSVLGIYSLASQFGNISDVVLNSVQSAFQPWMFETIKREEDGTAKVRNMAESLMWVYGLLFIGVGTFSKEAILIMASDAYTEAWRYVPLVVMGIALKSPLYFLNSYFYFEKGKTQYIFRSTLVYCLVNVALTALLVPVMGLYGSILADILAMIIRTSMLGFVMAREAPGFYSIKKLILLAIVPILFLWVAVLPSYLGGSDALSWQEFGYKAGVVLCYLLFALLCNRKTLKELGKGRGD